MLQLHRPGPLASRRRKETNSGTRSMCVWACACAQPLSRVWLCNPVDWNPPGSSVHGIFQARVLEWAAISSSRGSSWPGDWSTSLGSPASPALAAGFFTTSTTRSIPKLVGNYKDLGKEHQREGERNPTYGTHVRCCLKSVPRGQFSEQVSCLAAAIKENSILEPICGECHMVRVEGWQRS